LHSLGALIAAMHLKTELYKPSISVLRETWDKERGFRHAHCALSRTTNTFMKAKFLEAHQWLLSLKQSMENYGLIHADFVSHNLFIDEAQIIHVIDFDDSCYHWHAFDLAIVIYHLALDDSREVSSAEENIWLEHLLEGYRSVHPLNENEAKNISKFVNFACLRLYFWIEDHQHLDTFMDDAKPHVEKLKKWAEARIRNSLQ
jgi:Ser/Thr protein kinase RdoA (MazF antagonist)